MSKNSTITLLHLYGDQLNLYGENGNLKVLAKALHSAGCLVETNKASLGDRLSFTGCDLVYIGCGTEAKQLPVLAHLQEYREVLQDYLTTGGLLLATGNAADLFGQRIVETDGTIIETLGLIDYETFRLTDREVGEVLFRYGADYLIGFQNRGSRIECSDKQANPLFSVEKGFSTLFVSENEKDSSSGGEESSSASSMEGFNINGFIASSVLGLLTRNPAFLTRLAEYLADHDDIDKSKFDIHSEKPLFAENAPGIRENLAISMIERFDLQLDVVAYKAFLANHHSILLF